MQLIYTLQPVADLRALVTTINVVCVKLSANFLKYVFRRVLFQV